MKPTLLRDAQTAVQAAYEKSVKDRRLRYIYNNGRIYVYTEQQPSPKIHHWKVTPDRELYEHQPITGQNRYSYEEISDDYEPPHYRVVRGRKK